MESFWANFYRHLATFYLSHFYNHYFTFPKHKILLQASNVRSTRLTWFPPWRWQGQSPTALCRSSCLAGESTHCLAAVLRSWKYFCRNLKWCQAFSRPPKVIIAPRLWAAHGNFSIHRDIFKPYHFDNIFAKFCELKCVSLVSKSIAMTKVKIAQNW